MITTPTRYAPPWLAIAGFLVGMAGIAGSITIVFLGMRSVLDVGGQCASGGPYVIAVPCPDGTWTLPLAIFAGLGFVFLAVTGGTKIGGLYAALPGLAWVGLFCSLGFNFLQWGLAPPADPSVDSSGGGLMFVLLGLMFEVMGIVPLVTSLVALRPGATRPATILEGGSSFDPSELMKTAEAFRTSAMFQPATGGGGGGTDLVAELERLTALHQAGNLTDEEFSAAKQNLINGGS